MTHSCTGALEMAAMLLDLRPGDEVIMPSYTFVSTANAFVLRGAIPVFVDIRKDTLNIDEQLIEAAISERTRAIVVVHYAGVACAMDVINEIALRHDLVVIEDAAQGLMSRYKGRPLGSIGNLGAVSFHETKNIISGEGGALLINEAAHSRAGLRSFARREPIAAAFFAGRSTNTPGSTWVLHTCRARSSVPSCGRRWSRRARSRWRAWKRGKTTIWRWPGSKMLAFCAVRSFLRTVGTTRTCTMSWLRAAGTGTTSSASCGSGGSTACFITCRCTVRRRGRCSAEPRESSRNRRSGWTSDPLAALGGCRAASGADRGGDASGVALMHNGRTHALLTSAAVAGRRVVVHG